MPETEDFGTIKIQKPAIKKLTIEAECDDNISYPHLEKIVRKLKRDFKGAECKIGVRGSVRIVLHQGNQVEKTLFEEVTGCR